MRQFPVAFPILFVEDIVESHHSLIREPVTFHAKIFSNDRKYLHLMEKKGDMFWAHNVRFYTQNLVVLSPATRHYAWSPSKQGIPNAFRDEKMIRYNLHIAHLHLSAKTMNIYDMPLQPCRSSCKDCHRRRSLFDVQCTVPYPSPTQAFDCTLLWKVKGAWKASMFFGNNVKHPPFAKAQQEDFAPTSSPTKTSFGHDPRSRNMALLLTYCCTPLK